MKTLFAAMLMLVFASAQAAEPVPAWKPEKGARYELYLCAGQSNMDGRAQAKALVKTFHL